MHQQAITEAQIAAPDASEVREQAITHFDFTHQVFKTPGARFLLKGANHVPTFGLTMGDIEGLITIETLRKEFAIEADSVDGKLLDLVVTGLRYVSDIRPLDAIPSELLSGEASWEINAKHRERAEQRLQVQLVSWVSGKELLLTNPADITAFLELPENKEKLRQAFKDAAVALGYDAAKPQAVIKQLELLARELCYVEALRDRYAIIPRIAGKLGELAKTYGSDGMGKMEISRIQALLKSGISEYSNIFNEADAQTGEIIAALKSIDRQVKYIRNIRDKLYFLFMQWEPYIQIAREMKTHRTPQTEKALAELYRFLAPRYSSGQSMLKKSREAQAKPPAKAPAKAA